MTLDELIGQATILKQKYGGDYRVSLATGGNLSTSLSFFSTPVVVLRDSGETSNYLLLVGANDGSKPVNTPVDTKENN